MDWFTDHQLPVIISLCQPNASYIYHTRLSCDTLTYTSMYTHWVTNIMRVSTINIFNANIASFHEQYTCGGIELYLDEFEIVECHFLSEAGGQLDWDDTGSHGSRDGRRVL